MTFDQFRKKRFPHMKDHGPLYEIARICYESRGISEEVDRDILEDSITGVIEETAKDQTFGPIQK